MGPKSKQALGIIAVLGLTGACKSEGDMQRLKAEMKALDERQADQVAAHAALTASTPHSAVDTRAPSVKVLNVAPSGLLSSGFLVGSANDDEGIDRVEVKVDEAPFEPAEGTTSWSFKLPIGKSAWKRGSVHVVRVRAVDTNDNASPLLSFTLVKGVNRDVNGDGYPDLAVGARGYDEVNQKDVGRIYVFHGSASGIQTVGSSADQADTAITGTGAELGFGTSLTLADFNGDGYADLAAGEPEAEQANGRAYVVFGGRTGLASGAVDHVAGVLITGVNGQRFGAHLAAGDFDGDGADDLAAAQNRLTSRVYVFSGRTTLSSKDGLKKLAVSEADVTIAGSTAQFGAAMAIRDVNDDGYADLAIGERTHGKKDEGAVYLHLGGAGMLGTKPAVTLYGKADGQGFGQEVAFADLDGDRFAELLVASRLEKQGESGKLDVYDGTTDGAFGASGDKQPSPRTTITGEAGENFAWRVTTGDMNGDGYEDVIASIKQGIIVIKGSSKGLQSRSSSRAATSTITGQTPGDQFGASLDTGADYNHDGRPDLIVGTPGHDDGAYEDAGRVYVFYSNGTSFTAMTQADAAADLYMSGDQATAAFGSALGR